MQHANQIHHQGGFDRRHELCGVVALAVEDQITHLPRQAQRSFLPCAFGFAPCHHDLPAVFQQCVGEMPADKSASAEEQGDFVVVANGLHNHRVLYRGGFWCRLAL